VDKIPVLSMAYGLSAAAIGKDFPWVFNPPDTYWDGASAILKYMADKDGGFDKLKGKKIGYIFLDAGYGREPIPLLEQFAKKYGFTLLQYPVPANQMQNQSSLWLNIRRDRPDWIFLQGWGAMNPTAVKEATRIRYPMDHMIGIWWSGGEDDARAGGQEAAGYTTANFNGVGGDYPALKDIVKYVVSTGKSQTGDPAKVGENLYNRGVYNSVLMAEAIRTAQKMTGKKVVTPEDVRNSMEHLEITPARWKEIGLEGFAPDIKITCSDHSGHHKIYMVKWDGKAWTKGTDWFEPMKDVVRPMLEQAAEEYVSKNQPWPKRAEPCS
jgi:branched-chain amino acid transport system substrate-binding protein